ncbi:Rv2993c-like domain-containing protein [Planctomycetota bacterium]
MAARRFVRYRYHNNTAFGLLQEENIHRLQDGLFENPIETGQVVPLLDVEVLAPCQPSKILCVGLNYASHVGDRPLPERPERLNSNSVLRILSSAPHR